MSGRASAARYARALFEVAVNEADVATVGASLSSFAALLQGHAQLKDTLENPALQAAAKQKIVGELSTRLGLPAPLAKLLGLLAERGRLGLVEELNTAYQERLREHQGVIEAEVTTASALDGANTELLRSRLQTATGKQITLTTKVDPSLIGGVVARIGSTVYDGSLSTQLNKMREKLLHR